MSYGMVTVIVHAKDEEEAFKKGKNALIEIAEERDHDSYITFDCEKERLEEWEVDPAYFDLPPVLLASSSRGMELIERGWQYMAGIFMDALKEVKLAVEFLTPEEIMEEVVPKYLPEEIHVSLFCIRDRFLEVGGEGKVYLKELYFETRPITSRKSLNSALTPREGLRTYVIPALV